MSIFIDKRTFEVMLKPAPEKLTILIEINMNIAAGLNKTPAITEGGRSGIANAETESWCSKYSCVNSRDCESAACKTFSPAIRRTLIDLPGAPLGI